MPSGWNLLRIKEISDVKGGKRLPKGYSLQETANEFPYITVSDMYPGGISIDHIKYVPSEISDKIKNYRISKNDLFISVAGTLGIVGKVPEILDDANLTENADKLTNLRVNKEYLYQVMSSDIIQNEITREKTISAQPKLALKRIRNLKIPLPNNENEVEKISDILLTWDKAIELKKQLIDLKKDQKKGLMQKLLTGKVRVSTFEDEWEKYKIKDVAESYDKYREPVKASDRIKGETPYYGANGIQGFIDGYTHNGEYVLLAEDGVRDIENYSVFYVDNKIWVNNHAHVLKGKSSLLDTKFLYYSLQVANIKPFLVGGSRAKLNAKAMMKIPLNIPSLMEQKMIVEVLAKFDNEILLLKKELEALKEQKKGLMQQLLTGKTRVKV